MNKTFLRAYVPLGSTLTGSTAGIDTQSDSQKTEFSFMLSTPVGGSTTKKFQYILSIPNCQNQASLASWYRQPGLQNTEMKSR